jgi:DNA repair protein RadC
VKRAADPARILAGRFKEPGGVELAARLLLVADEWARGNNPVVECAKDAALWFRPLLDGQECERLAVLALTRRNKVLDCAVLTVGNDAHTIVDPKQIFRWALAQEASAVILAHNHPSGDPTPSYADIDVTTRCQQAGAILGVQVLDHLVIGAGRWVSLREEGLMPAAAVSVAAITGARR